MMWTFMIWMADISGSSQGPGFLHADNFLISVEMPYYLIFFTYSVMFFAMFLMFFFKQHSNLLLLLLYVELCLLLLGFLFTTLVVNSFSYFTGMVYALTILALSAAEAVIGLSLLLVYFKANSGSISLKSLSSPESASLLNRSSMH